MPRYLISVLFSLSVVLMLVACDRKSNNDTLLVGNEIHFFYQTTCSHCHDAAKYIKNKYPTLKLISIDIRKDNNMAVFQKALQKYDITGQAGTPLITFETDYIMGWSESEKRRFDRLVQPYLREEK